MLLASTDVAVTADARSQPGQAVPLPSGFNVLGVRAPSEGYLPLLTVFSEEYTDAEDTGDRKPRVWRLHVTAVGGVLPVRTDWQGLVVLAKEPVVVSMRRAWL
jgi:hypothetical protein